VVELLLRAQLATSRAGARRLIDQGGVRINGDRATLETRVQTEGRTLVQVGRRFRQIVWM
jgi:ribosomal protein S4